MEQSAPKDEPHHQHPFIEKHGLENIPNFRDLATATTVLAPGLIFRSGTPAGATQNDIGYLVKTIGLKSIIDLRSHDEVVSDDGDPNRGIYQLFTETNELTPDQTDWLHVTERKKLQKEISRLRREMYETSTDDDNAEIPRRLYRVPFINKLATAKALFAAASGWTRLAVIGSYLTAQPARGKGLMVKEMDKLGLAGLNKIIIERNSKPLADVLKILCDRSVHPVVINCSHGKDRTGLICAIILRLLGATIDEIADDYHISESHGTTPEAIEIFKKRSPLLTLEHWTKAPKAVMKTTLLIIDGEFGGIQSYLTSIGFDEEWQARLQAVLKPRPAAQAKVSGNPAKSTSRLTLHADEHFTATSMI
eukprot:m.182336 g.182336  ORF g.182336 m.182336 type:complete len:364 (+) comp32110_c0_seq1:547-1638(+)